ncbi:MAG: minichromosome maintenance protein MCM [Euryarchaeota archaeon]|nr:minichromosome maintenance protein MCM [Euryarchaeota archaeon]MDE1837527.1 minichromosome maintenance protein MCM [Euryarchaeota archaeon]MDE1880008.1 minichromosome maintenance protein MCM [Euryarchaeota archaeon]MDE2046163.1 minichromosome maintenance protein MCM [Thermoplasmata archaeon]
MAIVTTASTTALSSGEQTARWMAFLEEADLRRRVLEIAENYPQDRSLTVPFGDLERIDRGLADTLLERPETCLAAGEAAMRELLPATAALNGPIRLRVAELPSDQHIPVHLLRREHLGKLVAIDGVIRRASTTQPQVVEAVFECAACRQKIRWPQERTLPTLRVPPECDPAQNGCGKPAFKARFSFLEAESLTVDFQRLDLQEDPERLKGGRNPENLAVHLSEDLVEQIYPGTRVTVTGVLRAVPRPAPGRGAGATHSLLDVVLVAVSLEKRSKEYGEIEIGDEDRAEIERWRGDPAVFDRIVDSLAPSIKGMRWEKEAIALQLFGGVEKLLPDGVRVRGDIHCLIIGDPGLAKSQLLLYVSRTAPRGVYASGKGTTSAGLTAAAVRDEATGRWSLEAGAMVLASGGLLALDEADKMSKEDRSAMHEGLEQGQISIAKAGITATLSAKCPVLAAANPKFGRFTMDQPPHLQFDLPPTLLSRFDVILPLRDRPDETTDRNLARAILSQHQEAEAREGERHRTGSVEVATPAGLFSQEFLKKYIAYARQNVRPVMDAEAYAKLESYYMDMRKVLPQEEDTGARGGIAITPRQLEALVRLTEAAARSRLSAQATILDADRAVRIMEHFLSEVTSTGEGKRDIDLLFTGITASHRDQIGKVRHLLERLQAQNPQAQGVSERDLVSAARSEGIGDAEAKRILDELERGNEVYRPRQDLLRLI